MSGALKYPALFSPGRIGTMTLRNRIIMTPMGVGLASESGELTDAQKCYYESRARGGAGMIIVQSGCVEERGRTKNTQLWLFDDKFVPGLKPLADAIKRHGAKAGIQLHHIGRKSHRDDTKEKQDWTREELAEIVAKYAAAAQRAQKAGFDGVEILAARSYLISSFLSRAYNTRQDEFGGSIENRARLLVMILRAIRQAVGRDYPVWCRLDGKESYIKNGITVEESIQFARMAQEAGSDAIHVVGGDKEPGHVMLWREDGKLLLPSMHPHGYLLPPAIEIKKAINIPVIGVGRLNPTVAEKNISEGNIDFAAMGRTLTAEPELPNKAREGREEDITPCIVCLRCRDFNRSEGLRCSVNPTAGAAVGLEQDQVHPAATKKRITIIGGGPAGMEAALVAAQRGHKVTLIDRSRWLGGSMLVAGILNPAIRPFIGHQVNQLKKYSVNVRLNTEATPGYVLGTEPDEVVIAVGGEPPEFNVPGVNGPNVISGHDMLLALTTGEVPGNTRGMQRFLWRLAMPFITSAYRPGLINRGLGMGFPIKGRVVVLGGGFGGFEVADALAEKGKIVTVLEEGPELGYGIGASYLPLYRERMEKFGVRFEKNAKVKEITPKWVKATVAGTDKFFECETVVLAMTLQAANTKIKEELEKAGLKVTTIGDAAQPGKILEAVAAGFRVAQST